MKLSAQDFRGLDRLTYLTLACGIKAVPTGTFDGLAALRSLSLDRNYVLGPQLAADVFDDLSALEVLSLRYNALVAIETGTFKTLKILKTLSLTNNFITSISAGTFDSNTELTSLDLGLNLIAAISERVFLSMPNVDVLIHYNLLLCDEYAGAGTGLVNCRCAKIGEDRLHTKQIDHILKGAQVLRKNGLVLCGLPEGVTAVPATTLPASEAAWCDTNRAKDGKDLCCVAPNDPSGAETSSDHLSRSSGCECSNNQFNIITECAEGDQWFPDLIARSRLRAKYTTCPTILNKALQRVTIAGNAITSVPADVFRGVTEMTLLDLSSNEITSVHDAAFDDLKKLAVLKLGGNRMVAIDKRTFKHLESLQRLDLSYNAITSIMADTFQSLSSLTWLNLRDNRITTAASFAFRGLKSLTSLEILNSPLKELNPSWFGTSAPLKSMLLQNCVDPFGSIASIPDAFFKDVPGLTSLSIHCHRLASVTARTFAGLGQLERLTVATNLLHRVDDDAFEGLPNLSHLELRMNRITQVTKGMFTKQARLTNLILSYNAISFIAPGSFTTLRSLERLHLGYNDLTQVPSNICDIISMKRIDLNYNRLSSSVYELPFNKLKRLEGLNLAFNQITTIPATFFKQLSKYTMRGVYLGGNLITSIAVGAFAETPLKLVRLDLNIYGSEPTWDPDATNPLYCPIKREGRYSTGYTYAMQTCRCDETNAYFFPGMMLHTTFPKYIACAGAAFNPLSTTTTTTGTQTTKTTTVTTTTATTTTATTTTNPCAPGHEYRPKSSTCLPCEPGTTVKKGTHVCSRCPPRGGIKYTISKHAGTCDELHDAEVVEGLRIKVTTMTTATTTTTFPATTDTATTSPNATTTTTLTATSVSTTTTNYQHQHQHHHCHNHCYRHHHHHCFSQCHNHYHLNRYYCL